MSLLNGIPSIDGHMPDYETADASKANPLFTYTTIETPVNAANSKDNIELLKKNGDLIGKYYKQVTDLVAKSKAEDLDISNDLLDLLNNFAYDRDKLFADIPTISIPSVWTTEDLDKSKNVETTITSTDDKIAEAYNKMAFAKRPKNQAEFEEQQGRKMRNFSSSEEGTYSDNISRVYQSTNTNLFEQKLNDEVDKSIDDTDKQLKAINEAFKKGKFKEPADDELDRSLSLTYGESRKGDKWFAEHQKKYHKDYLRKIKKNPFYGGVSPIAHCYWKWMSCSIGTSCDIICEECEKKYEEAKARYEKTQREYNSYCESTANLNDPACPPEFVVERTKKGLRKQLAEKKKEADKLYKQSRCELRELDA